MKKDNLITTFIEKKIDLILVKYSSEELKMIFNSGLKQLEELVEKKPKGWANEIDAFKKTFKSINEEIERREKK